MNLRQKHHPCSYQYEGKSYLSFPTIEMNSRIGVLSISREINLYYCKEDKRWFGDMINSSGWIDLDEKEALLLAKKFGLEENLVF